jgi:2-oxoglutarate-Fe(II)-dependent oxygenase superfamily protein
MELLPDYQQLIAIADENAQRYRTARPYPHIVLDEFFDPTVLKRVVEEFPDKRRDKWAKFDNERSIKLASRHETQIPQFTRTLIHELNSGSFLEFLEHLTGVHGLLPDPHLVGGGLHEIEKGGFLKIHADFNWYKKLHVHRRLNVIVYLNQDWKEEFGGHFEMWDKKMEKCQERVSPVFNRTVIFNTTDDSYHGHPEPLTCPEGRSRRSLALYYYTVERPEGAIYFEHGSLFKKRPDEHFRIISPAGFFRKFIPPICIELLSAYRRDKD